MLCADLIVMTSGVCMSSSFKRRTVLKGAAVAAGVAAIGTVSATPAFAVSRPYLPSVSTGYPSVVDTGGRGMVAFGVGPEGRCYHRWQSGIGGAWSA